MSEVFDLDAVEAEAHKEPFTFRFDGHEYECQADPPIEMVAKLGSGDILGGLEAMVGEEQWASILAAKKKLGVVAAGKLVEGYAAHLGVTVPNSSPSTTSSSNTDRR